jgi:hypothetical protein
MDALDQPIWTFARGIDPRQGQVAARRCRDASCRLCGERGLRLILDLGAMPLSDGFLQREQLDEPEPLFPLELAMCPACSLVQIVESVPADVLFDSEYPYYSSVSETMVSHCRRHAQELIDERQLDDRSLVIEIASNDGYMLRNFVARSVPVLGIDPAPGPALEARERGVPTLNKFFGQELASDLRAAGRRASVLIGNNVLAHASDTNDFAAGIRTLLAEQGIAVLEFPYVRDLVEQCEFDTIYHEHHCYFSLHTAAALFARHGLHVTGVQRLPVHGGSLRVRVEHAPRANGSVEQLLAEEQQIGLTTPDFYLAFARRVQEVCRVLRFLLEEKMRSGATIAGYGAAAKGTILLNCLGVNTRMIEFVVDRNVHKQGRWVPGVRIPVLPPEALEERRPDYVLLLPWNLREEILAQQAEFRQRGGRFIIPLPEPMVV